MLTISGQGVYLGYVVHFANRFFSHVVHSGTHKATPLSIFSPVGLNSSLHTDIPCSPLWKNMHFKGKLVFDHRLCHQDGVYDWNILIKSIVPEKHRCCMRSYVVNHVHLGVRSAVILPGGGTIKSSSSLSKMVDSRLAP